MRQPLPLHLYVLWFVVVLPTYPYTIYQIIVRPEKRLAWCVILVLMISPTVAMFLLHRAYKNQPPQS
ncbi:MAG: hypothetical protein ACJ8C4_10580 [Gemmataceae bacterium]